MEIDVSGCVHYDNGYCGMNNNKKITCEGKYCYFRVVQQLKQENEENHEQWVVSEQLLHRAEQKLEKIKEVCKDDWENMSIDKLQVEILQIIESEE